MAMLLDHFVNHIPLRIAGPSSLSFPTTIYDKTCRMCANLERAPRQILFTSLENKGFRFGKAIAGYKGVTNKVQAQRESVDSPFASLQPVTLPEPSEIL